jgi:hypothetical protein
LRAAADGTAVVDRPRAHQHRAMTSSISATVLLLFTLACSHAPEVAAASGAPAATSRVYVVGTLYRRHATVATYSLDQLRAVIGTVDANVWALDVTPTELATEQVHVSKIEYPAVIFPLLRARGARAYAAEPPDPMFTEIVQSTLHAIRTFDAERPAQAAAIHRLEDAAHAALQAWWSSPADANSEVTDRFFAGIHALSHTMIGPARVSGQARWVRYMADVVLRAAREHPGRSILVLVGIENRHAVLEQLRRAPTVELVAMDAWIRDRLPAGDAAGGSR